MILCLKCFSLWPSNAVFCGKCRRALGVKRCPKGHDNPLFSPAMTCLTCNEGPLDGVPCLPLGWVASLLAILALVALWRWGWTHPNLLLTICWKAFLWALSVLFDTSQGRISCTIRQFVAWYVVLWMLSYLLPQSIGRSARDLLKQIPRLLWRGVRSLFRLLKPLVVRTVAKVKAVPTRPKDTDSDVHS